MTSRQTAKSSSSVRWNREQWVEFGIRQLARHGASALTVDRLCESAKLTKGSFYHHFPSVEEFLLAIGARWRETETDAIAKDALACVTAAESLKKLSSLSDGVDHRLELGVRTLAASNRSLRDLVNRTDTAREAIIATLLERAYGLAGEEAAAAARLFHSLHLAALLRSPRSVGEFSRAAASLLSERLTAAPSRRRNARSA